MIGFSDIDKYAIQSYYAIRQDNSIKNMVTFLRWMECRFVMYAWSFPCQDISLAGKQRGIVEEHEATMGVFRNRKAFNKQTKSSYHGKC